MFNFVEVANPNFQGGRWNEFGLYQFVKCQRRVHLFIDVGRCIRDVCSLHLWPAIKLVCWRLSEVASSKHMLCYKTLTSNLNSISLAEWIGAARLTRISSAGFKSSWKLKLFKKPNWCNVLRIVVASSYFSKQTLLYPSFPSLPLFTKFGYSLCMWMIVDLVRSSRYQNKMCSLFPMCYNLPGLAVAPFSKPRCQHGAILYVNVLTLKSHVNH